MEDEAKRNIYKIYEISINLFNNFYNRKMFINKNIYSKEELEEIKENIKKLSLILEELKENINYIEKEY